MAVAFHAMGCWPYDYTNPMPDRVTAAEVFAAAIANPNAAMLSAEAKQFCADIFQRVRAVVAPFVLWLW